MIFDKFFKKNKSKDSGKLIPLEAKPVSKVDYYAEGKSKLSAGLHFQAIDCFQAAIAENPNNESAYLKLAECYKYLGKTKEAEKTLYSLLAVNPACNSAHDMLSELRGLIPEPATDLVDNSDFEIIDLQKQPTLVKYESEEDNEEYEKEHYNIDEPYDPRLELRDYQYPTTDLIESEGFEQLLQSQEFQWSDATLPIIMGRDDEGNPVVEDLTTMPNLLVAGVTNFGMPTFLNGVLLSLLFKKHPAEVKFIIMGDKRLELTPWQRIERQFLAKLFDSEEAILTDPRKVVRSLNSLCMEMDNRYDLLKDAGVRGIKEYNSKFIARRLNSTKEVGLYNYHRFLPYMVVVVYEFGDLIMSTGREVEQPIVRISQLARAVGIHLILATNQPKLYSTDIQNGFQSRMAFRVGKLAESNAILGESGAQRLTTQGEALLKLNLGVSKHIQCQAIFDEDIDRVVDFISVQNGYPMCFLLPEYFDENDAPNKDFDLTKIDALFEQAARLVVLSQHGSTSLLQRKLELGYNRAGKIMDQLEAAGIVGPSEGSSAREVLVRSECELEEILRNLL